MWLRQNTAATVVLGPFVDSTDGVTAETALTISQADVRLAKNGAAFGQKNDATAAAHMENGYYSVPLNATDTNTLGRLKVAVNEAGALPAWENFIVLPANVYDALVAGSDLLQVDVQQWLGSVPSALENSADIADAVWDEPLSGHGTAGTAGAALQAAGSAGDPWSTTLPGAYGAGTAGNILGNNLDAAVSSRAAASDLATIAGYLDTEIAAILEDTGTTLPAQIAALNNLSQADIRAAVGLAAANLDAQLAAIETDTQDIQSRLPASLTGGAMNVNVVSVNGVVVGGTGAPGSEWGPA